MTAITSYSTLKTAFGDWLHRTDLSDFYDGWIDNAEARFNYGGGVGTPFQTDPLRVRQMIKSDDLTLSDGAASLPSDFLETIRVTAKTDPRRKLENASPDWLDSAHPTTDSAPPSFYAILGSSLIVRPTTSSEIELQYYQKLTALSDDDTTNWLLTAAPNVYLYAGLFEAGQFLRDPALISQMGGLMVSAINGLTRSDQWATQGTPARRSTGYHP